MRRDIGGKKMEEEIKKEECDDCSEVAVVQCDECDLKFCRQCKYHNCIFGREYFFTDL